jgi:Tfp pilus assembly protein PilF
MLDHDASYAGTHYALALVAAQKAEKETARREFTAALKLWSSADADLAEPHRARKALKDH